MKDNLYAIKDRKGQLFHQPFVSHNSGVACRMIAMREQIEASMYSTFPDDYFLAHIGTWDPLTGTIEPNTEWSPVAEMIDILNLARTLEPTGNNDSTRTTGERSNRNKEV